MGKVVRPKSWKRAAVLGGASPQRLALFGALAGFGLVSLSTLAGGVLGNAWLGIVGSVNVPPDAAGSVAGRASVIDGDTLEIHGTRIRLVGIDAPESRQTCQDRSGTEYRCGQRAALALADRIGASPIACSVAGQDRYGRSLATCASAGLDVGEWLVSSGWALAYRQYSPAYVGAEERAKAAGAGVWQGEFAPPWQWREANARGSDPVVVGSARKGDCAIKGNVGSKGERIYHMPGQDYYGVTRVSQAKGERWFCSEAEARAAGWRASRR